MKLCRPTMYTIQYHKPVTVVPAARPAETASDWIRTVATILATTAFCHRRITVPREPSATVVWINGRRSASFSITSPSMPRSVTAGDEAWTGCWRWAPTGPLVHGFSDCMIAIVLKYISGSTLLWPSCWVVPWVFCFFTLNAHNISNWPTQVSLSHITHDRPDRLRRQVSGANNTIRSSKSILKISSYTVSKMGRFWDTV